MAVVAHNSTGATCAKCGMPHLEEITTFRSIGEIAAELVRKAGV